MPNATQHDAPKKERKPTSGLTKKRLWFFKALLGLNAWSISLICGWTESTIRKRISQWKLGEESDTVKLTEVWLDREGGAERLGVTGIERDRDGVVRDLHLRVRDKLRPRFPRFSPRAVVDWAFVDTVPMPDALARELEDR